VTGEHLRQIHFDADGEAGPDDMKQGVIDRGTPKFRGCTMHSAANNDVERCCEGTIQNGLVALVCENK
jgi:hypothetical protein